MSCGGGIEHSRVGGVQMPRARKFSLERVSETGEQLRTAVERSRDFYVPTS